jgi:hypothetical protein
VVGERERKEVEEGGVSEKAKKKEERERKKTIFLLPAPVPVEDSKNPLGRRGGDVGEVRVLHGAAPALLGSDGGGGGGG